MAWYAAKQSEGNLPLTTGMLGDALTAASELGGAGWLHGRVSAKQSGGNLPHSTGYQSITLTLISMLRHALAASGEQGRGSLRRCRGGQLGATKRECARVQTRTLFVARSGFSLHCTAAHFSKAHVTRVRVFASWQEGQAHTLWKRPLVWKSARPQRERKRPPAATSMAGQNSGN